MALAGVAITDGSDESRQMRELASGVDALYLSGRAVLPEPFVECLAAARAQAEASGSSQAVSIAGVEFDVASHGMGRYRYCLSHRYGQVGVSPSTHLPALRVQPRTEFLHGIGVREACGVFMELLGEELGAWCSRSAGWTCTWTFRAGGRPGTTGIGSCAEARR